MIELRNLTKMFQETLATENLTLQIREGEIFGLLGPNGAGKTTTVRMLAGLIAPTSGFAAVAGFQIGLQDQQVRRSIGFLTEVPGFYDRLSAWNNLQFYARLYGVKDVSGQMQKYMQLFRLWDRRNDVVGTFSKGMKQKLALARALLHEPSVLLLDEPTSGLDPEMQKMVRDIVAGLRHSKRTILLCTHNLDEAERLCDRVAVLKTRIVAIDTPEALRHRLFGHRIQVRLRKSATQYVALLRTLPFITALENIDNTLRFSVRDPSEENPQVVRELVNAGAEILYVSEEEHSLEEVYLKLLKEEKA